MENEQWMLFGEDILATMLLMASVHKLDHTWKKVARLQSSLTIIAEFHGINVLCARAMVNGFTAETTVDILETLKAVGENYITKYNWSVFIQAKTHFVTDFDKALVNALNIMFDYDKGGKRGQFHYVCILINSCRNLGC